jgi:CRP/FNR family cyclic AMP-dependent transcriptional regulator
VITRLEKATMVAALHDEPDFSELFMSYLLSRNSRIEEDSIDQLFNSSEKRLARVLLLLANSGK